MRIKIGIVGYGNLGRGVECALKQNQDMEAFGVFTRRDPSSVHTLTDLPVFHMDDLLTHKDDIDVLILCGGSANDLPKQTVELAEHFNVIDSFDTHAKIPEHFDNVNKASQMNKNVSIIAVGWDPGLFSINRLYGQAILANSHDYTFWGPGISQGHSDAIRRIEGVVDARQYTIPIKSALKKVRDGEEPELSTDQKHERECFVVASEGADLKRIEEEIKTMPNYFADYKTTVHFISQETLDKEHAGMPHGGTVLVSGSTGLQEDNKSLIEYKLSLDSNPEFTSSVLVAYARAAYRLSQEGHYGCKTVFDIAPSYLHPELPSELRKKIL